MNVCGLRGSVCRCAVALTSRLNPAPISGPLVLGSGYAANTQLSCLLSRRIPIKFSILNLMSESMKLNHAGDAYELSDATTKNDGSRFSRERFRGARKPDGAVCPIMS